MISAPESIDRHESEWRLFDFDRKEVEGRVEFTAFRASAPGHENISCLDMRFRSFGCFLYLLDEESRLEAVGRTRIAAVGRPRRRSR